MRPANLMQRFGVDESLIGDLAEQRRAGRSRSWFALQSVAAISTVVAQDIRRHPVRALMAVVLGLALRDAYRALWSFVWHYTNPHVARLPPFGFVPFSVLLAWMNMLMAIPGWIAIGWLLLRLGGVTLVLPYVIVSAMFVAPDLWRQANNAIEDVRFRPYFYIALVRETLFTISTLAGAVWWPRPRGVQQIRFDIRERRRS